MALSFNATSRVNPNDRLILAVFFSYATWLVALRDFTMLGAIAGLMALLLTLTTRRPVLLFRHGAKALPAAVFVTVIYWIFAPSEPGPWFSVWGKSFGAAGLTYGSFFACRFLAFLLGGIFLYETSTPERLARALVWFLTPLRLFKIPIQMLYYITWFALRTIPVLVGEAQITRLAQRARGARFSGPPGPRLSAYLSIIGPVFAAGVRRSDGFALALEARGFDPAAQDVLHRPAGWKATDWVWLAGLAGFWILFILYR